MADSDSGGGAGCTVEDELLGESGDVCGAFRSAAGDPDPSASARITEGLCDMVEDVAERSPEDMRAYPDSPGYMQPAEDTSD
ncbi:MAG: hypothetical protein ACLFRA_08330, partial [Alphaproteobacteria bacterium]